MTHRALVVAAVSTPGQAADDKASIPEQLAVCRAACDRHGWQVVQEISIPGHSRNYDDLAELVASSPEYGEIIRVISSGAVTLVVAYSSDRLWRTDALRASVTAICRRHGVQVYTVNQPIEPLSQVDFSRNGNEGARWIETVGGLVSESENTARVRRSMAGKRNCVAQGYAMYSGNVPYGYRKIKGDNVPLVVPSQSRVVRWIFNRRALDRWSTARIQHTLNDHGIAPPGGSLQGWRHEAVRKIINNPVYKGAVFYGGVYNEHGKHEPIVSPELWAQAQAAEPTLERSKPPRDYLLSGLCVCGLCGGAMSYSNNRVTKSLGLICCLYTRTHGRMCHCNRHSARKVEPLILDAVQQALSDPDAYLAYRAALAGQNHTDDRTMLEREIADHSAEIERWRRAYGAGVIELHELEKYSTKARTALQAARARLDVYTQQDAAAAGVRQQVMDASAHADTFAGMSTTEQRDIIRRLIKRIILHRGVDVKIEWL